MPDATSSPRKVTLSDIADGCGVSRATVSLVLRGSPLVNADTRARVQAEYPAAGCLARFLAAPLLPPRVDQPEAADHGGRFMDAAVAL